MFTVTATFDLTLLYFVAANVVFILGYVLVMKHRSRAMGRNATLAANTVVDYFRETGSVVSAECLPRDKGRRFIALIRTRPSQRFRNSHIIELALIAHVRKVRGLDLEKVYWCFPVKSKQDAVQPQAASEGSTMTMKGDEYFDEELSTTTKPPGYRVRELARARFDAHIRKHTPMPEAEFAIAAQN